MFIRKSESPAETFLSLLKQWNELVQKDIRRAEREAKYISEEAARLLAAYPEELTGLEVCCNIYNGISTTFPTTTKAVVFSKNITITAGFNLEP